MNTYEKRQLYRVIMKYMALLMILVLFAVMLRSVFYRIPEAVEVDSIKVKIDAEPMAIQLVRWNDQDIAVLRMNERLRQQTKTSLLEYTDSATHPSLNSVTRAQDDEYFIFNSRGSGVGCPINITRVQGLWQLRDICTQITYDLAGRPLKQQSGVKELQVPPHYWQDETTLILGQWQP